MSFQHIEFYELDTYTLVTFEFYITQEWRSSQELNYIRQSEIYFQKAEYAVHWPLQKVERS